MITGRVAAMPVLAAGLIFALTVSGKAQDTSGSGPTATQVSDDGKQIYEEICQACHMADAKGGGGAGASIPALADNANLADPKFAIDVVVKGRGGMPWFTDILTPAQMAAVITYVRGHFNKYTDVVTETDVKKIVAGASSSDSN